MDSARLAFVMALGAGSMTIPLRAEPEFLKLKQPVEGAFAAGEFREYTIALQSGQYASLAVEQRSINVAVTVFGPDDQARFSADNDSIGDDECVEIIADLPGTYRVRITASDEKAPTGRYAVRWIEAEPATPRHRLRVKAARAFSRAVESARKGTRDQQMEAIRFFQEALSASKNAADIEAQARTLRALGLSYIEIGDQQKALEVGVAGLGAAQRSGNDKLIGRLLEAVAEVHNYFGDKRAAIGYYEQALVRLKAAGDRAGEGSASSNLGVAYSGTGEKRKALECFDRAETIFRELQDRRMLAEVAGNKGVTYDNLGEYELALESHRGELALEREFGDRLSQAIALNNIGSAYSGLAEYQKALDAYTAALEINRSLDSRRSVAINLNNIAWVYANLSDQRRALRFYQEAMSIDRTISNLRGAAIAMNNIANIYSDLGEYRKAIDLHQEALPLRRKVGDTDGEANSLNGLGNAYAKLGEPARAREYFEAALAIHRRAGNRHMLARTLRDLSSLARNARDYDQARNCAREALSISRAIHDRRGEAEGLAELARIDWAAGDVAGARHSTQEAIASLEKLRLTVASPALRATLIASTRDLQEQYIEILTHVDAEAALVATERGRARSLLEMLGESAQEIRRGVDAHLLDREREVQRMISRTADRQARLTNGKHTEMEVAALANDLDRLTSEYDQVQSRIRETSPHYGALTQPEALDVRRIQTDVLDDQTVLLEYALGTNKSFLWVVTKAAVYFHELPRRGQLDASAKRVYDLLTARNRKLANETLAARTARIRESDEAYLPAAAELSAMLLGPAGSTITGKRLLIVAEGVLQNLPFGVLPEPGSNTPLLVSHEIVTSPSASVLDILRKETKGRRPAEKSVAIFADPVFSADDVRVQREPSVRVSLAAPLRSGPDFLRLRFSRNEAYEIERLAPPQSVLKALDFDAARETVLQADLSDYRILHFATHSLLDNDHAELSGIVLSLVDRQGRPRDGFLRLYDIHNLRLASDLVVLSACKTALGEDITGEGLIGLTRAFIYAGAPRVVATLWEIDDRTTAALMKRFYEGLFVRDERPAEALRSAQVGLWKSKGWEAPYYWAAFTLQGEWR